MIRQVVYRVLDKKNFKYYYYHNQVPEILLKDNNFWIEKIKDIESLNKIPSIANYTKSNKKS